MSKREGVAYEALEVYGIGEGVLEVSFERVFSRAPRVEVEGVWCEHEREDLLADIGAMAESGLDVTLSTGSSNPCTLFISKEMKADLPSSVDLSFSAKSFRHLDFE